MWTDAWAGLPYIRGGRGPDAYDCLGLCQALQRARHGRAFPGPGWAGADGVPREGDVLLFRILGRELHVGYALGPRDMLHVQRGVGTLIDRYTAARWARRMVGVYRWDA